MHSKPTAGKTDIALNTMPIFTKILQGTVTFDNRKQMEDCKPLIAACPSTTSTLTYWPWVHPALSVNRNEEKKPTQFPLGFSFYSSEV